MNWLDNGEVLSAIGHFLAEDIGRGDITTGSTVEPDVRGLGRFLAKEYLVICGLEVAEAVFLHLDAEISEIETTYNEGDEIEEGTVFATLKGYADVLLTGERVALNILQRMSGVATLTRQYVKAVEGTKAQIVDTRKTTPGLRLLEKYAVTVGGGRNHRMGLDDGVLIKDNHIALCGGIAEAIRRAREYSGHAVKVEVECDTLQQVEEAVASRADIILLDNMTPDELKTAVGIIGNRATSEASGGVNLQTVRAIAESGVDIISVGALTHSARALDIGLDIELQ